MLTSGNGPVGCDGACHRQVLYPQKDTALGPMLPSGNGPVGRDGPCSSQVFCPQVDSAAGGMLPRGNVRIKARTQVPGGRRHSALQRGNMRVPRAVARSHAAHA